MKSRRRVSVTDGRVAASKTVPSRRCGKMAYSSRKLAGQAAAQSRKFTGENIHAYKCEPCHCWHIGHPPGLPRMLAS